MDRVLELADSDGSHASAKDLQTFVTILQSSCNMWVQLASGHRHRTQIHKIAGQWAAGRLLQTFDTFLPIFFNNRLLPFEP